jgi:hypothetical protein
MKFWQSLFLEDIGRKVIALGIAFLVWSRVSMSIESEHPHPFTIVTTAGNPENHQIQIDVPDGWLLVDPKENSILTLNFYGNVSDFQNFISAQCAATVEAVINEAGNASTSFDRKATELQWLRAPQAQALLSKAEVNKAKSNAKGNEVITFKFAKHEYTDYILKHQNVPTEGDPVEGYRVIKEEMTFTPNAVEIHGPFGENGVNDGVAKLEGSGELFKTIAIPTGTNQSLKRVLELSDKAKDGGMWMEPAMIAIELPITATSEPIEWRPNKPEAIGTAPNEEIWTITDWDPGQWMATYTPVEGLEDFAKPSAKWLKDNVKLVVHLDQIRAGGVTVWNLLVDWIITDPTIIENIGDLTKLKQAIRIYPADGIDERDARTVEMTKQE